MFSGNTSGSGGIEADKIVFTGQLNPGNSPGLMTLDGSVELLNGSILTMEIAGGDRGDLLSNDGLGYDALNIYGDVFIDSNTFLDIDLLASPAIGDFFDLAYVTGTINGNFENITNGWSSFIETEVFGDNDIFSNVLRVQYDSKMSTVPTPPGLILFFTGILALGGCRRVAQNRTHASSRNDM